jgi:predicted dehydrogenase
MKTYRAAVIGCSRMGGFIDNEVVGSPVAVLPFSHAAGYMACARTDLIACSDVRTDVMAEFGKLYKIPPDRQYTGYRELIDKEQPDILSIATQPEQRAEITIYAAEHGVKAIYAEKAMAASLGEAYAMVEALEQHGVFFNLGTNRRWSSAYDQMKAQIDSGELGALKNVIIYNNGTLFNTGSHYIDLVMRLNSDHPALWVQGNLRAGDHIFDGDILREDPVGEGLIYFANDVTGYLLVTPRGGDIEAICENGALTAYNDGLEWHLRHRAPIDPQGRTGLVTAPFAGPPNASSTLRLIEDLVYALDTGEPTRGGPRIALASTEMIFALIESHRYGGAKITLPVQEHNLRLQRNRGPNTPQYTPI